MKWVLLLGLKRLGQKAEVWRVADTHVFSSATLPALMPSVCHSGESRKTGPTWLTRISGNYQLASLTSFNINLQQKKMSLIYFSLSVFSCLDSLLILGEQLPTRLDVDEKDNGEKPGPFLQMDSSYQVSKSDDILAGWFWDYPRAPAASCFQVQRGGGGGSKWQSQLTFGI